MMLKKNHFLWFGLIVEVIKKYYPDPTDESGRFGMVKVKALKTLKNPVFLSEIKANEDLQEIALVKQSRLSVMEVKKSHFDIIIRKANEKKL